MNSVSITFPILEADQDAAAQPNWIQPGPTAADPSQNAYLMIRQALPNTGILLWEETIDMSSFVVQDKTFFPIDVLIQEPGLLLCGPTAAEWRNEAAVEILDLISNTPLTTDLISNPYATLDELGPVIELFVDDAVFPGSARSTIDDQFIVYGRYHAYAADTTSSFPGATNLIRTNSFGRGLPTAADKLYCLRIVKARGSAAGPLATATLKVPETKYTIIGKAEAEEELERVYRLRQSYMQKQG